MDKLVIHDDARTEYIESYVPGVLADVLKQEEQKVLYEAFSLAGEDADVEFAVFAQREASEHHE